MLARYVAAFEAHDTATLVALMADDVRMSMPPYLWWVQGRGRVLTELDSTDFCRGTRLVPTSVNGSHAFGHYLPIGEGGAYVPWALIVLEIGDGGIRSTTSYLEPAELFALADLAASHPATTSTSSIATPLPIHTA